MVTTMNKVLKTITSKELTYEQKVLALAGLSENSLDVLNLSDKINSYLDQGALCSLFEGNAPYRPRYIMPDYKKYMKNGSEFLGVDPPTDLDEAITALMIIYKHVPSITSFPVYLGNLDKLLEPFLDGLTDEEIKKKFKLFLNYLDRTITDGFCHGNLGPEESRAGRLLLEVEQTLQNEVPNLTLKYDPDITPDYFAELAICTSLICANPAIANHKAHKDTFKGDYGISSCYNILPVGGGSFTLSRIVLTRLVKLSKSIDHFMDELLPEALGCLGEYMNERVRFLVEESGFFESSFLVNEGLIELDRFTAMFGITGLAEAVNALLADSSKKYGTDEEADKLGEDIMNVIYDFVGKFPTRYCKISGGHFMTHAQVGLENDIGITSGVRIPVGDEPDSLIDHLRHSSRFHKYITTGCGDIFPMESTVKKNPAAALDLVKGAFTLGVKYISFYEEDGELVRITGYLAKKSEMEKFKKGGQTIKNTTHLAAPNYDVNHLADRKVRGRNEESTRK